MNGGKTRSGKDAGGTANVKPGEKAFASPGLPDSGAGDMTLPDIDTQSEGFRLNRAARRNALIEDYVELIADLLAEGHEARQVDIATRLGVSQPTVAKMLTRLANEGYVHRRPYRGVFLTEMGQDVANQAKNRHQIVENFLRALGISEETVRVDAEGIEHYVSDETLAAFHKALEAGLTAFMTPSPRS
ncbi:manganese transport regulator MntR [Asaia bogorensis NBRC 16594]|uniref:Transcriptional regulator MntR n=1 Tax=Asaia bogorensis NBRC 16594 TaxID=1231624 RepID=A0AAN4U192_9PROT|nr:transcriptional regulator MntR/manganese transport regulator [Asaia bogorensis NBRC 16594]GBQ79163.1 manganese transport regulator MntR [Asaia bogorensis NBRC 16594]GEL52092.1 hypothetical protein ABO01nite_00990 [Asaia bogorensis NBRC 16594]